MRAFPLRRRAGVRLPARQSADYHLFQGCAI